MPLFCNGVLFNREIVETLGKERYEKIAKAIASFKTPVTVVTAQQHQRSEPLANGATPFYKYPNFGLPLEDNVTNEDGGVETWRYCERVPKIREGSYDWQGISKSKIISDGKLIINCPREAELAYFVKYLSSFNPKFIRIEDKSKEAAEFVNTEGMEALVKAICLSDLPGMAFYRNENKLRDVCASWNIPNSSTVDLNMLRRELFEKVRGSQFRYAQTQRGYEEFIQEVNGEDPFHEYRANIQKAFDKNIVKWDHKDMTYYWVNESTGDLCR